MASRPLNERLKAGGIADPQTALTEAARAGLRLPLACALLEKESGGGRNVFGHDPTIFSGAGEVTRAKYRDYKRRRVASGNRLMQGVGPCQLTWWEFQDAADREGGCWRAQINMRVGFRHLAELMKRHGEADGARRYNGSGPAAEAYSRDLLARARAWEARLAGAPAAATGPRLIRRGDDGLLVQRLTERLSYVRSRQTGRPYLDGPRRLLDAEGEAALKAFQREHRLQPDGVFGRASAQALNRAVALEKARRARPRPASPLPKPAAPARMLALIDEVRRRDAQTDRSWRTLVAYGSGRRRLLAELSADSGPAGGPGMADVTAVLLRIEDKLETLIALEESEDAASHEPAAQPVATSAMQAAATAPATATGGGPPAVSAGVVEGSSPAGMSEGTAPPSPTDNGAGEPSPPPTPRAVRLADLSDAELARRIERLDRATGIARGVLIARYARVEKELARLVPAPPRPIPRPPTDDSDKEPGKGPRPAEDRPPRKATNLSADQVRSLQKSLNRFTGSHLKGVGPLIVDGVKGHATARRISTVKYYLGYTGKEQRSAIVTPAFVRRLRHPRSVRHSKPVMLARAVARRHKQRKAAKAAAAPRAGVATFDGRPVAAWLKPYLDWARQHGWRGTLNSGWRDPAYSERLCQAMCGAPSCPGRCAGRSSNHAGSVKPAGAVDVSDYVKFGQLMRECPYSPRIFNALGARDPVHFSSSGR